MSATKTYDADTVSIIAQVAQASARGLSHTADALIDGANHEVIDACDVGLSMVDLLMEVTQGRLTEDERYRVEQAAQTLSQSRAYARRRLGGESR